MKWWHWIGRAPFLMAAYTMWNEGGKGELKRLAEDPSLSLKYPMLAGMRTALESAFRKR